MFENNATRMVFQGGTNAGLAQGISSLGRSIAGGIEKKNRLTEQRKRLGTIAEQLGVGKDQVASMSLGELEGIIDSFAVKHTHQLQQREQQRMDQEAAAGAFLDRVASGEVTDPAILGNPFIMGAAQLRRATGQTPDPSSIAQFAPKPVDRLGEEKTRAEIDKIKAQIAALSDQGQTFGSPQEALKVLADQKLEGSVTQNAQGRWIVTNARPAGDRGLRELELNGKKLYVGPGNRYFDENFEPIKFSEGETLNDKIDRLIKTVGGDEFRIREVK